MMDRMLRYETENNEVLIDMLSIMNDVYCCQKGLKYKTEKWTILP